MRDAAAAIAFFHLRAAERVGEMAQLEFKELAVASGRWDRRRLERLLDAELEEAEFIALAFAELVELALARGALVGHTRQ